MKIQCQILSRNFASTVCRQLKARDLITSPTYVVVKVADAFYTKTTWPNEIWQAVAKIADDDLQLKGQAKLA